VTVAQALWYLDGAGLASFSCQVPEELRVGIVLSSGHTFRPRHSSSLGIDLASVVVAIGKLWKRVITMQSPRELELAWQLGFAIPSRSLILILAPQLHLLQFEWLLGSLL